MNKSKGNKRSADESKETDGTESGFPFAADNAAAPSDPDLADQSASLMDGGGSAAAGDATTAGYAQQDPSLFAVSARGACACVRNFSWLLSWFASCHPPVPLLAAPGPLICFAAQGMD